MEGNHTYLAFTINILNSLNMWPCNNRKYKFIKEYYILMIIVLSTFAAGADLVLQFYDDNFSFTTLVEGIIAVSALCSVIYTSICFMIKRQEIKRLVQDIKIFEEFLPKSKIEETERTAKFYSKSFIIYGIIGNILYACLPLLTYQECNKNKSNYMIKYGISCGIIGNYVLPFRYDVAPLSQIIILEEAFVTTLGTTIVMTVTMLVCGILWHTSANLKHLKTLILDISHVTNCKITNHVKLCVKYHTAIVEFSDKTNNAFSVMMLVHITWTSFIISVLGFGIIMGTNYFDSFRFVMHLGGWLGMLFLVCLYGQMLMDKSSDVSKAVYETSWYDETPDTRKSLVLILLRSQRPLVLEAAGLSVMCFPTFLAVLYTAYSYFTLLLKIKP